jgi:RimJ/RimL family protein N-acetyltransferase
MDVAMRWAQGNPDSVRRVELNVATENVPAIQMYGRLGFVDEGVSGPIPTNPVATYQRMVRYL